MWLRWKIKPDHPLFKKNTSERGGYIVPQIYVTDVAASTVRRVKELKAFQKVWLDAGQERTVSLQLGKGGILPVESEDEVCCGTWSIPD